MHLWRMIWVVIVTVLVPKSKQMTFQTSSTKCTIEFHIVNGEQLQGQMRGPGVGITDLQTQPLNLKSCVRKVCQSYMSNGNCKSHQLYLLEQPQQCYQQCCGSKLFAMKTCEDYNKVQHTRELTINHNLIIISSVSLFGLITALLFLGFKFKTEGDSEEKAVFNKNCRSLFSETQRGWKRSQFKFEDKRCCVCRGLHASVALACRSYYHWKCLQQLKNWSCAHCARPITKARVFCHFCLKFYITLQAGSLEQLQTKLSQCQELHPQCYELQSHNTTTNP